VDQQHCAMDFARQALLLEKLSLLL
jgi:hypothetical protein